MKKVCFLNGHLILRDHKTGVHYFHEIVTKKIAETPKNYEIRIAYFDNSETRKAIQKKENEWIKQFCKPKPGLLRIFSYLLPIEFFFGRNDIYFCDGLMPITVTNAKRICLVHDLMIKRYPENYSFIKKIYLNTYFNQLSKADLILCVSETTKKDIVTYYGIDPKKITVCYNGASFIDEFEIGIQSINNCSLLEKYFFYIGDMRPNKNLYNTVLGFLNLCEAKKIQDLYFYIAGKKNGEYEKIKQLVETSNYGEKVRFLGYVSSEEKVALYKNSLAVILLSYFEGFGMPIIEGMHYYKPVITSNVSSMKEIGEGAAILADPNSMQSISSTMYDVYQGIDINVDAYGKKLKKYSFDTVAEIINRNIEELL